MPHNFETISVSGGANTGGGQTVNNVEEQSFGPDSDEVWDVLSIEATVSAIVAGSQIDGDVQSANFAWFLHNGFGSLPVEAADLPNGEGQDRRSVLSARGKVNETVEDHTNSAGMGGNVHVSSKRLELAEGDLRVAFPGEFQIGFAGDASSVTNALHLDWTVDMAFLSQSRHQ